MDYKWTKRNRWYRNNISFRDGINWFDASNADNLTQNSVIYITTTVIKLVIMVR